jgi:hypothetical protein
VGGSFFCVLIPESQPDFVDEGRRGSARCLECLFPSGKSDGSLSGFCDVELNGQGRI